MGAGEARVAVDSAGCRKRVEIEVAEPARVRDSGRQLEKERVQGHDGSAWRLVSTMHTVRTAGGRTGNSSEESETGVV